MLEKKNYNHKERQLLKESIHLLLNQSRGYDLPFKHGYKVLEYGWLRKLRQRGYNYNQTYLISKRTWLWEHEAKDFLQYAGVACSL